MKLALYGGSFDPPHAGHVAVVKAALETLSPDRLIIVPAYRNPFKSSVCASGQKRFEWLKAIFAPYPKVEISDFELSLGRSVYTVETLRYFAPRCDTIYLIIGADNLAKLQDWHCFEEIDAMVTWAVASRGEIPIPEHMVRLDVNEPISSTDFRNDFTTLGLETEIENDITTYYKELYESKN